MVYNTIPTVCLKLLLEIAHEVCNYIIFSAVKNVKL